MSDPFNIEKRLRRYQRQMKQRMKLESGELVDDDANSPALFAEVRRDFVNWMMKAHPTAQMTEADFKDPAPRALYYACEPTRLQNNSILKDMLDWSNHDERSALRHVFDREQDSDGINSKFVGDYVVNKVRSEDSGRNQVPPAPPGLKQGTRVVVDYDPTKPNDEQIRGVVTREIRKPTRDGVQLRYWVAVDATSEGPAETMEVPLLQGLKRRIQREHGDYQSGTALILACMCDTEQAEVVHLLLESGADCRAQNSKGKSPLHFAARRGFVTSARRLLQMFPDIDLKDDSGETPLHAAVRTSSPSMVRLLLHEGANFEMKDCSQVTQLGRSLRIRLELFQREAWGKQEELKQQQQEAEQRQDSLLSLDDVTSGWCCGSSSDVDEGGVHLVHPQPWTEFLSVKQVSDYLEMNTEIVRMLMAAGADFKQAIRGDARDGNAVEIQKQSESAIARLYFDSQTEYHVAALHPNTSFHHPYFHEPLSQHAIRIVWERTMFRKQLLNLLGWFVFILFFMFFGYLQTGAQMSKHLRYWEQHNTVVDQLVEEQFNTYETKAFVDIGDTSEIWAWAENVWLTKVYAEESQGVWRDANNQLKNAPSGRVQQMYYFMGRPRVRQWRSMQASECTQTIYDNASHMPCFEEFDLSQIDKTPFGPNNKYTYTDPGDSFYDDFYPNYLMPATTMSLGGFSLTMPHNATEGKALLAEAKADSWVDMNTRLVMFEGCLGSPSSEMITTFRLIIQQNANGGFIGIPYTSTTRLNPYATSDLLARAMLESVFALCIAVYAYNELQALMESWHPKIPRDELPNLGGLGEFLVERFGPNSCITRHCLLSAKAKAKDVEEGKEEHTWLHDAVVWKYLYNAFNILDMIILSIFGGIVFLHFWQFYEAYDIDWNTVSLSDRSIPMVFKLAWIQRTKLQLVAINLFLCWIVALEYLYIQENFAMMVKIILGMLQQLASFIAVLGVFVMAFASFSYVLFGINNVAVSTFYTSISTTFDGSLGSVEYDGTEEQQEGMHKVFFFTFALIMVILMLNLLIAVMSEAYETVKESAAANWAYTQLSQIVDQAEDEEDINLDGNPTCWERINASLSCLKWAKVYRNFLMPASGMSLKQDCVVLDGQPGLLLLKDQENARTLSSPSQEVEQGDRPSDLVESK